MLFQLDGSHHAWLEERGPRLCLLLGIDDATGTAPHAVFQEQETTEGYLHLLRGVVEQRGAKYENKCIRRFLDSEREFG